MDNLFVFTVIMASLRGAAGLPAEGAADRHRDGTGHAGGVHRGRRGGDQRLQLGVLPVRRVPHLHRAEAGPGERPRGGLRSGTRKPSGQAGPPVRADHRRVRRRQVPHPGRWQAGRHPADAGARRHRLHRPAVRAGLDPGDLRPDSRSPTSSSPPMPSR